MSNKAWCSILFIITGAIVMVPLMCSAWLYHIDPTGIRGWVAFGAASYAWALVLAVIFSARQWPVTDTEDEKLKGHEDMKRKVKIQIRKSSDALRFWVVVVGGNGEVMWRTEEYTRIFSAKRAARAMFNRTKSGLAELDLNP